MTKSDLPNLDILRSFAVLLVACGHFLMYQTPGRWTGWMGLTGVCLFFIHTCLVLMWSLERDPHIARFYVRRVFRLYPLWLVVLAIVVLAKVPTAPAVAPHFGYVAPSALELLANITMTFNLWFGDRIVGASWSLPVEAQMYILLPLFFFFVRSTRAMWALLMIDALVIVSVWSVINIHATTRGTLIVCMPFFLPGVMAYLMYKRVKPRLPAFTFLLFLAVMSAAHNRFGNQFRSCFWCLIMGLALPFFRQVMWVPLTRAAHLVARYSYGIYLCHIPCIWLSMHLLPNHGPMHRIPLALLFITLFSVPLYHLVEAPMMRVGARLSRKIGPGPMPKMDEASMSLEPAP